MTFRKSTGLQNHLNKYGSLEDAFHQAVIEVYSGSQPASADAAPTGTLLCTITDNSSAHTDEVLSSGTVTLTGGSSGSVTSITVNSINVLGASVAFNSTLTQTAADIAAQINRFRSVPNYRAESTGAVVTIYAMPGTGVGPNTYVVATTIVTMTKTDVDFSGGVAAANGLKWDTSVAGVISKLSSQTWSGVNGASGTAGWFRVKGAAADAGALDSIGTKLRMDGAIATSGAEMNLTSTAFSSAATTTLNGFTHTFPA